jgi:hypothetical protein
MMMRILFAKAPEKAIKKNKKKKNTRRLSAVVGCLVMCVPSLSILRARLLSQERTRSPLTLLCYISPRLGELNNSSRTSGVMMWCWWTRSKRFIASFCSRLIEVLYLH